jgi:hypothetical protein
MRISPRLAARGWTRAANRPRFAPPAQVAGVGLIVLLALVLVIPTKDALVRTVTHGDLRDEVAEQYLWNLLRVHPDDAELSLHLAEQRLAMGKLTSALSVLAPWLESGDEVLRLQATRLAAEILEQQFYAALPETEPRRELGAKLRTQLQWLAAHEDNPILLERVAQKALAMSEPVLAATIYRRIAGMAERWPEWYAEAARVTMAAGDHGASAALYRQAYALVQDNAADRNRYLLAALRALLAGNRLDEAVALAVQADTSGDDPEVHTMLLRLYAQSTPSAWRSVLRTRLQEEVLAKLQGSESATDLDALLEQTRTLGDDRMALQVLKRIADSGAPREATWYANAARLALAQSEYRMSAQFFWQARRVAPTLESRRAYFIEGGQALQAGNLLDEAVLQSERELGDLSDDPQTLYALAVLARAANRTEVAQKYALRLIRRNS